MTNIAPSNATKVLTVTAVLAAILFTVGHADAGTQRPVWKQLQLLSQPTASPTPPTAPAVQTITEETIVVVEEVVPASTPAGNDGEGSISFDAWPGDSAGNNGGTPNAAPTPSAVLGGIAMLGLIAGRRRRQEDNQNS